MEEFNKALPNKNYVEAANMLQRVRAANIIIEFGICLFYILTCACDISVGKDQCGLT